MTNPRSQAELVTLRKLAQDLAATRKERPTSVHLLAAIASRDGRAGDILRERRLDAETLLKAGRSFDEESQDPLARATDAARELGKRAPLGEPTAVHLLLALLADRTSAAHRALVQAGIDTSRLRTAAMQHALGVVASRRTPSTTQLGKTTDGENNAGSARPVQKLGTEKPQSPQTPPVLTATPTRRPMQTGVAVPLFPPPNRTTPAAPAVKPPTLPPPSLAPANQPEKQVEQERRLPLAAQAALAHPLGLDKTKTPTLFALGKNLTLAAALGEQEPIIGRETEVDEALDILAKKNQNSCLLIGPAGVGKTSIARGIAQRLAEESAKRPQATRLVIEIAVSELIAGTGNRGALAERMTTILRELREETRKIILFFDEVHELFAGGLDEATAELKLALARSEIRMIGATSPEEYRQRFESDPALARRFSTIFIEEPEEDEAFLLCKQVCLGLGKHHGLKYSDESIAAAISWSMRYLPGRALPDKALSILDLAGARLRRRSNAFQLPPVSPTEVAAVVSALAEIPEERLLETDRERMLNLENLLAERVVGHGTPLSKIARVLRRNAAGIRAERPLGTFLLLGPTGVGKTETAKAIAESLFHSADAMTRLDLSEYSEAHAIARLIGAPPGYVGHEAGGQLTESVRRRAYQVILLDEIEKAHRDVLLAFLQVFDEGRMTDGRGRRVDFTNTVIILTSNLGAAETRALKTERSVGFGKGPTQISADKLESTMLAAARSALPPELYNRLDEVLVFASLGRNEVKEVAKKLLESLGRTLFVKGIKLEVEAPVLDLLLETGGFDEGLGARPMKRAIMRNVEAPIAEMILRGELVTGSTALLSVENNELKVEALSDIASDEYATGT